MLIVNVSDEIIPELLFGRRLEISPYALRTVHIRIQRKQKIDVIQPQEQGVPVEKTVLELVILVKLVRLQRQLRRREPVCLLHAAADEKVRSDVVPLSKFIPVFQMLPAIVEPVQLGLNDIPGISVLLEKRRSVESGAVLVILAVSDIIDLPVPGGKGHPLEQMIHNLSVLLLHQGLRRITVSEQNINHILEDNVEVTDKQELLLLLYLTYVAALGREQIQQLPQADKLLVVVVVTDGFKPFCNLSFLQKMSELLFWNQIVRLVNDESEMVFTVYVFQRAEEHDKQLFVIVYFLSVVYHERINHGLSCYDRLLRADCLRPVHLVEPGMILLVSQDEKILILLIEISQ